MATIENDDVVRTRTGSAATSTFVVGDFPRRPWLVIGLGALGGFLLTVIWSAAFVDRTIGDNIANTLLGHDAKATPIAGIGAGIAFAFVSGLACTFTACNVAAFSAVGPLLSGSAQTESRTARLARTLRPLGWLAVGMVAISALYGAIVGIFGTSMPQFQQSVRLVPGTLPPVLAQSVVVFGVIGVVLIYLGLAATGLVPDPFRRIAARWPNAPLVFMGVLIGGLLIGRPFALFRTMFRDAAESNNVIYGAAAFVLQSLGNVAAMAIIFLLLVYGTRGRLQRWIAAEPGRLAVILAASFIAAGVFTLLYWDLRVLSLVEIVPWYPMAPWR